MLRLTLLLGVFAILGCSEKTDSESAKPDKPADKPAAAAPNSEEPAAASEKPATAAPDAAKAPPPAAANDDLCSDACRLLTKHALADLASGKYCELCGDSDPGCVDGVNRFAEDQCVGLDRMRNCVYAANGYQFKKAKWREVFGKTDWYAPSAFFNEESLSALEVKNIAAIRQRESVCKAAGLGPVSNKDKELVAAFFKKLAAKKQRLPKKLFLEGEAVSEKEFAGTLAKFTHNKSSSLRYSKYGPAGKFDRKKLRTIEVGEGDKGPGCNEDNEVCEGDEALSILVDKRGKIVALGLSGYAACPFVYVADGRGAYHRVGEILRHLSAPHLEGDQDLAIEACEATVRVQLRELKRERTELDSIALVIGDAIIAPSECRDEARAFCADDGSRHTLWPGDQLDLTFEIPSALRCLPAALRANGHYVRL